GCRIRRRCVCASAASETALARRQTQRKTARWPRARTPNSPESSEEPPVPVKKPVAEEQRHQRHAAQEYPKRHLIIAVDHLCRLPRPPPCRCGIAESLGETTRPLQPHDQNRGQPEYRSRQRSGENRQYRKLDSQKRTHHC